MLFIKYTAFNIFIAMALIQFIFISFPGTSIPAGDETVKEVKQRNNNPYAHAEIALKVISAANNTYGYDIFLYGRLFVHQPNIPGLPGNNGFPTKEGAQKVAEFVAKKIRNNEIPPTVTIDDLNHIGVLK
jgi:hypothetical protein